MWLLLDCLKYVTFVNLTVAFFVISLMQSDCQTLGVDVGEWISVLPRPVVDGTWAAAYDNSTYQRNSESWRLQLRYRPAGDCVQRGTVLCRQRPSAVYGAKLQHHHPLDIVVLSWSLYSGRFTSVGSLDAGASLFSPLLRAIWQCPVGIRAKHYFMNSMPFVAFWTVENVRSLSLWDPVRRNKSNISQ